MVIPTRNRVTIRANQVRTHGQQKACWTGWSIGRKIEGSACIEIQFLSFIVKLKIGISIIGCVLSMRIILITNYLIA